jgi:hypothetical protein
MLCSSLSRDLRLLFLGRVSFGRWIRVRAPRRVRHRAKASRRPGDVLAAIRDVPDTRPLGPRGEAPEVGFEWARAFDPDADYAWYFDTVLVRTPDDAPVKDPTKRVFGASERRAEQLAHFGRSWLYRLKPPPLIMA